MEVRVMGWWQHGSDGTSLHDEDTGLIWGDRPADAVDEAIDKIVDDFREVWHRDPTYDEMVAGIKFSLRDSEAWTEYLEVHPGADGTAQPLAYRRVGDLLNVEPVK
jgi:hypothetical protein